jgi:hypothetical protein
MTPTPRTDAHIRANTGNGTQYVSADFARTLERENAEAIKRVEAVDSLPSIRLFTTTGLSIGEAMQDFKTKLIQAMKGVQP